MGLDSGEAYQRCIEELKEPSHDDQAAQLYTGLSLGETVREVAIQPAELTKALVGASRRR
jgi:hypothetical protein